MSRAKRPSPRAAEDDASSPTAVVRISASHHHVLRMVGAFEHKTTRAVLDEWLTHAYRDYERRTGAKVPFFDTSRSKSPRRDARVDDSAAEDAMQVRISEDLAHAVKRVAAFENSTMRIVLDEWLTKERQRYEKANGAKLPLPKV